MERRLIRVLKVLGLVAGAGALIVLASPTPGSLAAGGTLVLGGALVRIWASGHLQRNREMTTSGPYAYVRDPLYLGRLLILSGLCIMAWGYALLLLPVAMIVFFINYMPRKHQKEMQRLEELFGERYRRYAAEVHSLLPRGTRCSDASDKPWSGALFWRENREHYFIGLVLLLTVSILVRA